MSREEVIKIIEDACWWLHKKGCTGLTQAEIFEAREMAIKALSQEPKYRMAYDYTDGKVRKFTWIPGNGWTEIEQEPPVTQKSDNKYHKEAKRWKNKWLKSQRSGKWDNSCTCSVCGKWRILESEKNSGKYKFCPNCGCRMVEPQESEQTE